MRYAFRGLRRNPLFAITAVATVAIGIGASTAVFSVVDRVLFRPLPYASENSLVSVGMMAPLDSTEFMFASEIIDLRRDPGPFSAITSFQAGALAVDLTEQNPVRLQALRVQANFLQTLGVLLVRGRSFTAEEDLPNGPRVAIISYGLWRSRFAGDAGAIGRTLSLDGVPTRIVGVLPANFETPTLARADVLLPQALDESRERQGRAFRVFARMKPGITPRRAYAELAPHFQRALETVPPQFRKEISLRVRSVRDRQTGDARLASEILFGAVLAVLLMACANVANLLLARSLSREREIAIRTALGASKLRLLRQSLAESLAIAFIGAIAGSALAAVLLRVFVAIAPAGLPQIEKATLDLRVLAFALIASLAAGLVFGIAPALRTGSLASGNRYSGPSRGGLRSILVATQIAVSVVLLTSAALLLRSLWNLENVASGMEASHVLTAKFTLGSYRYGRDSEQVAFFNQLEERLASVPGAEALTISDSLPPSGATRSRLLAAISVEGQSPRPEGTGGMVTWRYVTPGYFSTLGIPILQGRGFTAEDRAPGTQAVIISQTLRRRLFPNGNALGRRILRDEGGDWFTVIGITADVQNAGGGQAPAPEYYLLRKNVPDFVFHHHEPPIGWRAASVAIRTGINPKYVAAALRQTIAGVDNALPVQIETMRDRFADTEARPRFNATVLALFAAIALAMAAAGLFGVMSFLMARRTREFGIRMALGATPRTVLRTALAQSARWIVCGLGVGIAASFAAANWLRSLLFQVPPFDPWALATAVAVLLAVAAIAALLPANRAARLDPVAALREE